MWAEGPVVRVRLVEGSGVMVEKGGDWQGTTLARLVEYLNAEGGRYHQTESAQGRSGVDESGVAQKSWLIAVELDVHPQAPWLNVQWLMGAFMDAHIDKVRLKVGDRSESLTIPRDTHLGPVGSTKGTRVLRLNVTGRDEMKTAWGRRTIPRPGSVDVRVAGTPVNGEEVGTVVVRERRQAMGAAGALVIGDLRVTESVPVEFVMGALVALRDADVTILEPLSFAMPGTPLPDDHEDDEVLWYPDEG